VGSGDDDHDDDHDDHDDDHDDWYDVEQPFGRGLNLGGYATRSLRTAIAASYSSTSSRLHASW
jgi:hypothetical protein